MSYVRVPERLQINTIFMRVFKDLIVFFRYNEASWRRDGDGQVAGLNCKMYFSNLQNVFEKTSCFMFFSSRWRKGVIDVILFSGGFEQPVGDTQQRAVLWGDTQHAVPRARATADVMMIHRRWIVKFDIGFATLYALCYGEGVSGTEKDEGGGEVLGGGEGLWLSRGAPPISKQGPPL